MSDPGVLPPPPRPRYSGLQIVMLAIGLILLLPGACAAVFMVGMISDIRGGDPIVQLIVTLWVICFAISAGGIALIYVARRNARAAAGPPGGTPTP